VALKLQLEEIETEPNANSLESAFQTAKQKQVGAIITFIGNRFFAERKRIVELAGKYRLPANYPQKEYVDEGGLMSYGVDYTDQFRRAAVYVDKILKGAKPGNLPVQQATKFEFVVNLKAAKQIGLTIPVRVLERANKVSSNRRKRSDDARIELISPFNPADSIRCVVQFNLRLNLVFPPSTNTCRLPP
jgi:ABC-type uncharacterized transport system substrate-binding protein